MVVLAVVIAEVENISFSFVIDEFIVVAVEVVVATAVAVCWPLSYNSTRLCKLPNTNPYTQNHHHSGASASHAA